MTMTLPSNCSPGSSLRGTLRKTVALSGLIAALLVQPAFADEAAEVGKLMHAGQDATALAKADAFLARNPRDPQMRFLKGVILTEQNKPADAIAIFKKLTEDYPSLPEPYNNLAVLYAAQGDYDKARTALDAAIRTNPSYATAYENLGDVHAKLASQAYDKALQLDSDNTTAKSKLTLLRSLVSNMKEVKSTPASAPVPPMASATPASKPAAPAPVAPKPAPAPTPVPAPMQPPKVVPEKPKARGESAQQNVKPNAQPAAPADSERDNVMKAVEGWASAWSARDVSGYLAHYSRDFDTPRGMSHSAWESERRARIVDKKRISVKIESPRVKISGNSATVSFHQIYASDRLSASSNKTLVLEKRGGAWLIKQENAGS